MYRLLQLKVKSENWNYSVELPGVIPVPGSRYITAPFWPAAPNCIDYVARGRNARPRAGIEPRWLVCEVDTSLGTKIKRCIELREQMLLVETTVTGGWEELYCYN